MILVCIHHVGTEASIPCVAECCTNACREKGFTPFRPSELTIPLQHVQWNSLQVHSPSDSSLFETVFSLQRTLQGFSAAAFIDFEFQV